MATSDNTRPETRQASALDASLRLISELSEAMAAQVRRVGGQIDDAAALSLPPRVVDALESDARDLERQCGMLRERFALDATPVAAVPASPPRPPRPPRKAASRADAARTLALELQALGIDRQEVASRLVNTFEVDDADGIVDSVFVER